MKDDLMRKIEELEARKAAMPSGTLTYKTIKGKKQPYLQWTENGKSRSRYIKIDEREQVLELVEERRQIDAEIRRLKAYYAGIREILKDQPFLANKVSIGYQDFGYIRENHLFYVDKTDFIAEWWENNRQVTLITRPRRFGKTLTMSMVDHFFSLRYANRADLFENTKIWKDEFYRKLQGTMPVIFTTFANVKGRNMKEAEDQICGIIREAFEDHRALLDSQVLSDSEKNNFRDLWERLWKNDVSVCNDALNKLSMWLSLHHGKKVLILIDEYDTPLTEGYMSGYLDEMLSLMRNIFHSTLKTNRYLDRALLTGISRVARESLFSDMNHLQVASLTSPLFATSFGFTQAEVSDTLKCQDVDEQERVREWYDGFTFGGVTDIYNPWSITNYLSLRQFRLYWANSGGYGLISRLLLQGRNSLKDDFRILLQGESIRKTFSESISFYDLEQEKSAIWALLLMAGYLRADHVSVEGVTTADLSVTNKETMFVLRQMVQRWFLRVEEVYQGFCKYLIEGDVELMNEFLQHIATEMVSYFDVGRRPGEKEPERFYHGLVLGLVVDLWEQYEILSNRESGFGRYDIMMIPKEQDLPAILIEFKVRNSKQEKDLEETVSSALAQIEEKQYETELLSRGIEKSRIRKYGFAFEGKRVLVGDE